MTGYSFDEATLSSKANVDPWKMHRQLHTGDPAAIESLATAFFKASGHSSEATSSLKLWKTYVGQGYKTQGSSPLDVNAEAHKMAKSSELGHRHTYQIAKILRGVGSDLDTATVQAGTEVTALNSRITSLVAQYNQLVTLYHHTGEDREPNNGEDAALLAIFNQAVAATRSHGGTVKHLLTGYETSLHGALKSMADLGYVPPDGHDEGPGGIDLSAGTKDGKTTVSAAKSGNKAQLQQSTYALSIINDAIKHHGGHVGDDEYAYLYSYYDQTAGHSGTIWHAVKGDATLKNGAGQAYANGLLNLTRGAEQTDDNGVGPYVRNEHGVGTFGRGGVDGLPASVQDVLKSNLGVVKDAGSQPMRRAEYVDGHWVIPNLGNDQGFTSLLSLASKDMNGGTEFSQTLGEAGLRWKQQLNTIDHNTYNWVKSHDSNPTHNGAPDVDPKKLKLPDGFTGKFDHNGNPINDDTLSSQALQTMSSNQTAATNFLLDAHDRRTLLGENWNHDTGAAATLLTGTAPDPSGRTLRNQAALDVMRDAGHDYKHLDALASTDVKRALTLVATQHLDTFAQDIPPNAHPGDGLILTGIDGKPEHGVFLNIGDQANYLKLVAGFGGNDFGLLHAAAMERGAQYVAHGIQIGGEHGQEARTMASLLNSRVNNAAVASANDTIRANIDGHGKQDAAAFLAEQKAATQSWVKTLTTDGIGVVLGGASLVAPEVALPALGALDYVNSTASTVDGDLGGPNGPDPAVVASIQHIQSDLKDVSAIPTATAQSALDTDAAQQWVAVRAQDLLPQSYLHTAGASELQAHAEAMALSADGRPKSDFGYTPGSDVSGQLNDVMRSTYGPDRGLVDATHGYEEDMSAPNGQDVSFGGGKIDNDQRNLYEDSGAWGSGDTQHSIVYGDDSTYKWVDGPPMSPREPHWATYHWVPEDNSPK
ncbi:hypothetical protein [uncultured Jatrophihabitans sp.]|uniref:putative alpha/beta hydrolase n=1 Tax=uncultured Jatrophihabitans sp. TaxID=1610747 RepID=UPI0035CC9B03